MNSHRQLAGVIFIVSLFFQSASGGASSEPGPLPVPSSSPSPNQANGGHPHGKAPKHPIDEKLGGPQSVYTDLLLKLWKNWPPRDMDYTNKDPNPVQMRCIETPSDRFYIGLDQFMFVDAPIGVVASILDDMDHYQELFPEFDDVHVVSRDENKIDVFWEQHIPLFFVPNVKYETTYLVDASNPDRRIYRYQLKKDGQIHNNDGIIVLERQSASKTRYTEYDFYNADWGPLKTFSPGRIWKDSVEGVYLSDVAIKLKAENPEWTYKKIADESKKVLEKFPVEKTLEKRRRFGP